MKTVTRKETSIDLNMANFQKLMWKLKVRLTEIILVNYHLII